MSDERWVRELAKAAKEDAEGDLPLELARPLDAEELARITAGVLPAASTANADGARVVSMAAARRRWTWVGAVAAPLAIAAGVAFYVGRGAPDGGPMLSTYDLVVDESAGTSRGDTRVAPDTIVHRASSGRLTLIARPRDPDGRGARASVWMDAGGALRVWPVAVQASSEGSFRIVADGDALGALPREPLRVVVFVADAAHLPSDEASARRALASASPGVQVLTVRIAIEH